MNLAVRRLAAVVLGTAALLGAAAGPARAAFELKDTPGQHLDVLADSKTVARWMYACDPSSAERLHATYKPYLHVFDAAGQAPITKGPGGKYSHHRGIFAGWKVTVGGKTLDFWHIVRDMANAQKVTGKPHFLMVHKKFLEQKAGPEGASFTALIAWVDADGWALVEEARTHTFAKPPAPALLQVDFLSRLKAVAGDASFGGDPEHAGVHYRPADEVDAKQTKYVFPEGVADAKKGADMPWAAEQYVLGGKTYAVQQMNHPSNPKGTAWSAYRDYGRFGAYPKFDVKRGQEQVLRYRFLIYAGEVPARPELQKNYEAFVRAAGR